MAQLAKELDELRQQRDIDQGKLRALNIKIGVQEASLEDAKSREAHISAQRDQRVQKLRESERALGEKYENLRAEFSALQGALDVARRRCETLEAELSRTGGRGKPAHAPETAEGGAAIVRLAR